MILSIIVPIYNGEKFILRCLNSLKNQNLDDGLFEIIAINDGSTDRSLSILSSLIKNNENIRLIDQNNKGLGATRNIGIEAAKGKYIYFLDVDDYLANDVLKPLIQCISTNKLDVLTFKTQVTDSGDLTQSNNSNFSIQQVNVVDGYQYISENNYRNEAWWYIIDLEFLKKTGFQFPEGVWMEDSIFTTKLFLAAHRIAFLPIDAHRYINVSNSILNKKDSKHFIKVIYDTVPVIEEYEKIINELPKNSFTKRCIKRLRTRQQSFVFFLIIRIYKSDLKYSQMKDILKRTKGANAYPLNSFIGDEYNRVIYYPLTFIFNSPLLLRLSFMGYRFLRRLK